jgi:hypothetical protein
LSSDNGDIEKLTNRSVHMSLDNEDIDEFTNRSVRLIHGSENRLVKNNFTNKLVHFRIEKDELTNKSVQTLWLREMILQIDQINLYEEIEDECTNRSTQS